MRYAYLVETLVKILCTGNLKDQSYKKISAAKIISLFQLLN